MSEKNLRLPEVPLGPYSVSRLISGGNPVFGGSHQTRLMSTQMREYFTMDRIVEYLHRCSKQGINTWQTTYRQKMDDVLMRFREEGGEMQFICLSRPDVIDDDDEMAKILALKPIGIVFQGEASERMWRSGDVDKIPDYLAKIRDTGVLVGLSMHNPVVMDYAEEKDWDLDFYMVNVYRMTRNHEELMEIMPEAPIGEIYIPSDLPKACEAIRRSSKTCLAFKVLAAGRTCNTPEQVSQVFEFVLGHIKPTDAMIVGMYPRYTDQIKENADLVRTYG